MRLSRRHRAICTARNAGDAIPDTTPPAMPIAVTSASLNTSRNRLAANGGASGRRATRYSHERILCGLGCLGRCFDVQ